MEVDKAIELLAKFKQEDSHEMFRDEEFEAIISLLKALEAENLGLKNLLQMIVDIAVDYDGNRKPKDLMRLVDELSDIAKKGLRETKNE